MSLLLWFRNDLRLDDHQALQAMLERSKAENLSCRAVFISTPKQWQGHNIAGIKLELIEAQLNHLARSLGELGIPFEVLAGSDFNSQPQLLKNYCDRYQIQGIYASVEPEINEIKRDQAVTNVGLSLTLCQGHCILPTGSVLNQQGHMFKRFTPFKKVWLEHVKLETWCCFSPFNQPVQHAPALSNSEVNLGLPEHEQGAIDCTIWPSGDGKILQLAHDFIQTRASHYHQERDIPSLDSTSKLSAYLAIGAISPRRLLNMLLQHDPLLFEAHDEGHDEGQQAWLNEIIWREFYRHLIVAYAHLCKGQNFVSNANRIAWRNSPDLFEAWCQGKTGYPLVDAAMRQLLATGWMHNRLRMVVASFLTKHLLVDWRHGERFFMRHLIDGDLAANNGGWQWAASTGCDAQPYFRIFNPIRQSERFDPHGHFIRKWVKELKDIEGKAIHFPNKGLGLGDYPSAIVDHAQARKLALEEFSVISNKS
ncbi:deoxyribodipyrimidine photo-lyase [Alginatibacterium sediminis]|uniref:Deoxyribodipyrimidine photo-lyase n=1 Tax=Alginatibacterium sediminis TaxID=2164068 RepID=A0A420E8K2_9ALTE|nr:deoxyribodipyrimidine photo-lyase [Alginatibacterium sediminis]RKF15707.1 deoxyribodipyrimidine photo-lyase [Alginatibacterium sediminis]